MTLWETIVGGRHVVAVNPLLPGHDNGVVCEGEGCFFCLTVNLKPQGAGFLEHPSQDHNPLSTIITTTTLPGEQSEEQKGYKGTAEKDLLPYRPMNVLTPARSEAK